MIELLPLLALMIYLAPFGVAVARDHASPGGVLVLNLLFGWTGIGWLVALGFAFASSNAPRTVSRSRRIPSVATRPRDVMPRILDAGSRD